MMPELPEVEVLKRGLYPVLVGRNIESVLISNIRLVREMESVDNFYREMPGSYVEDLSRIAKYLVVRLRRYDGLAMALILHMGMSGQLRSSLLTGDESTDVVHSHVKLTLSDRSTVAMIDPRTFGKVFLDTSGYWPIPDYLNDIGPDALDATAPLEKLIEKAKFSKRPIKQLLLDQTLIGGIGNLYGDEILHLSNISPMRPGCSLSIDEFDRIQTTMPNLLNAAIESGGSSLVDKGYRDINGALGEFQKRHLVYGRQGEPCLNCGIDILRVSIGNRSSFFCPNCQR